MYYSPQKLTLAEWNEDEAGPTRRSKVFRQYEEIWIKEGLTSKR